MSVEAHPPIRAASADRSRAIVVKRIRFASEPTSGNAAHRRSAEPWSRIAVEETLDTAGPPADSEAADARGDLVVALIPADAAAQAAGLREGWIGADALSVSSGPLRVNWRPGRAVVRAPAAHLESALEALTRFAFCEGELRRIEQALDEHEAQAQVDVGRAQVVRYRDRKHWRRLTGLSERFCRMRLDYARLTANVAAASRGLPPETRQLISRLAAEADLDDRLEAASDRLEACEDLYDGATDRIAEYRWFLMSAWLESGIVLLLLVEIGLLAAELYVAHVK